MTDSRHDSRPSSQLATSSRTQEIDNSKFKSQHGHTDKACKLGSCLGCTTLEHARSGLRQMAGSQRGASAPWVGAPYSTTRVLLVLLVLTPQASGCTGWVTTPHVRTPHMDRTGASSKNHHALPVALNWIAHYGGERSCPRHLRGLQWGAGWLQAAAVQRASVRQLQARKNGSGAP